MTNLIKQKMKTFSILLVSVMAVFVSCTISPEKIAENYISAQNNYDSSMISKLLADSLRENGEMILKSSILNYVDTAMWLGRRFDNFKVISSSDSSVAFICNINLFADSAFKTLNNSTDTIRFKIKEGKIYEIAKVRNVDSILTLRYDSLLDNFALFLEDKYYNYELKDTRKYLKEFSQIPEKDDYFLKLRISGQTYIGNISGMILSYKFKKDGKVEQYLLYMLKSIDEWEIRNGMLYIISGIVEIPFTIENGGRSIYQQKYFVGKYFRKDYLESKGLTFY